MNTHRLMGLLCAGALALTATSAQAVPKFKVYGWKTPDQGEMELVYWTDYIVSSGNQQAWFGSTVDKEGLFAHTFELEYGVTDRFTVAGYLDFEQPDGESIELVQGRAVVARYRFFEKGERFFDPAIYLEYYVPRKSYRGEGHDVLETRLILQKDFGENTLKINPIFEKVVSGPDVTEGLEFEYGISLYRDFSSKFEGGIELYGSMGEFASMRAFEDQTHYLVPAVEYKFTKHIAWNVGVGFGLTDPSDDVIVKSIIEFEL